MQQKTWSYDLCLHRYRVLAQTYFFVIQAIFCSFGPPLIPKIKKCNKYLEILSPDHMIPWYHVWFLRYQVQQTELFCHLGQVFVLLLPPSPPPPPLTAQKILEILSFYTSVPKIMIIRYTVPEMWCETNLIVIFIWGYTFPFYPFKSQKNEKQPGDIIILHECTKNHDQMLYCSWDMARVECYCYFSFREIFCPFSHPSPTPNPSPPLTGQKVKT